VARPSSVTSVLPTGKTGPKEVQHCLRSGDLDFSIRGTGFDQFEGAVVRVGARQDAYASSPATHIVLSGVISNGGFDLSCPDSLTENTAYPSYAVFIDVDGDGVCTSQDIGYDVILYAWLNDVADSVQYGVNTYATWLNPIGDYVSFHKEPFCQRYRFDQ
jgi:hypothetical protein